MRVNFQGQINKLLGTAAVASHIASNKSDETNESQSVEMHNANLARTNAQTELLKAKTAMLNSRMTRQQANAMMEQQRQDQIDQKQEFQNYIGNLETNFGGRVKDLPEAMQKQVYQQLGKEKR